MGARHHHSTILHANKFHALHALSRKELGIFWLQEPLELRWTSFGDALCQTDSGPARTRPSTRRQERPRARSPLKRPLPLQSVQESARILNAAKGSLNILLIICSAKARTICVCTHEGEVYCVIELHWLGEVQGSGSRMKLI